MLGRSEGGLHGFEGDHHFQFALKRERERGYLIYVQLKCLWPLIQCKLSLLTGFCWLLDLALQCPFCFSWSLIFVG